MCSHRRVPPSYFFFLLLLPSLIFGSCLRTRSISRADHGRTKAPPIRRVLGAATLPAAIYRCRLIRLTPSLRAASRVEWVAILIDLISDVRAGVNRKMKAKIGRLHCLPARPVPRLVRVPVSTAGVGARKRASFPLPVTGPYPQPGRRHRPPIGRSWRVPADPPPAIKQNATGGVVDQYGFPLARS